MFTPFYHMMSTARLKRNFDFLKVLQKASPKQRKALLENSSGDLILCIAEVVQNILLGNVKLSKAQKSKLQKYKSVLRTVASKKTKTTNKKKLLVQKGGFLSALLAPAIGIIGSLLGSAFQR